MLNKLFAKPVNLIKVHDSTVSPSFPVDHAPYIGH